MNANNQEIPPNATIRQEYVRCGNPDCQKSHGPYLYAYWKGSIHMLIENIHFYILH